MDDETRNTLIIWLRTRLACLGTTPHMIVRALKADSIVGKPDSASSCPIARYVAKDTTTLNELYPEKLEYFRVDVEPEESCTDTDNWNLRVHFNDEKIEFHLPRYIAQFADDFDHFNYPELIDPAWEAARVAKKGLRPNE